VNFRKVLKIIIKEFERNDIKYALIGGFALGALGIPRTTLDLDFLVDLNDINTVKDIMQRLGYTCVYQSRDVSQFVSDLKIFGEIDFIHAFRNYSQNALKRAIEVTVFKGKLKIKVLNPEDIIGFKLQAIANDKSRHNRDFADIDAIVEKYNTNLDWDLLKQYFSLFKMEKEFKKYKKKYAKIK